MTSMRKRQYRRSVSLSYEFMDALQEFCINNNVASSYFIETHLRPILGLPPPTMLKKISDEESDRKRMTLQYQRKLVAELKEAAAKERAAAAARRQADRISQITAKDTPPDLTNTVFAVENGRVSELTG